MNTFLKAKKYLIMDTGKDFLTTHCGMVETLDGRYLVYYWPFNVLDGEWKTAKSYLKQVKYDFENNLDSEDDIRDCGLFEEVPKSEIEEYRHYEGE